jgi:predicted ATPase with chaperone activity
LTLSSGLSGIAFGGGRMIAAADDPVEQLSELLGGLPEPITFTLKLLVAGAGVLTAIAIFFVPLRLLWRSVIVPRWYKPEERKRAVRRAQFARHLKGQIERLNDKEDWTDHRFAELEAEVEARGHRRARGLLQVVIRSRSRDTLRRERSLSRALARTSESKILLRGAPGSGKSVALRRVAY